MNNLKSLCLVLEGTCDVKVPDDDFVATSLGRGQHFGSSDLLKIVDIEYFGNIYAGSKGAKILVIKNPDHVIQLFERKAL